MKKQYGAIFFASMLLFAGCASKAATAPAASDKEPFGTATAEETTPRTVGDSEIRLSLCDTHDEQGFYSVEQFGNGYANILYIDWQSKQQIFLCNQPNCKHDTDSCLSYIELPGNTWAPMALTCGDKLLLVKNGASDSVPAGIQIADRSGENRCTPYEAPSGTNIGPGFYTDQTKNNSYFEEDITKEEANGVTNKNLMVKVDLTTGERTEIADISRYGVYGFDRDCFILYQAQALENRPVMESFYYLHLPYHGQPATIEATPFYKNDDSQKGAYLGDGCIYTYEYATSTFDIQNLVTGEQKAVDCSAYSAGGDAEHLPDVMRIGGNLFFYSIYPKNADGNFLPVTHIYDANTGEFSGLFTLTNSRGSTITPRAVVGDQFCVIYDFANKQVSVDGSDGPALADFIIPKYALISKEDYKNSRPNYQPITGVAELW